MARNNPSSRLHSVTLMSSCKYPYRRLNENTPIAQAMNWYLRDRWDMLIPSTSIRSLFAGAEVAVVMVTLVLTLSVFSGDIDAGNCDDDDRGWCSVSLDLKSKC